MSAGVSDQRMKGQGNQGMFGSFNSQSAYKYFPGNGEFNTWGSQQVNADQRKQQQYGNYYSKENRGDYNQSHNDEKSLEGAMQGMGIDGTQGTRDRGEYTAGKHTHNSSGGNKPEQAKDTGPKKMTWASVASQPAKPQIRASSSSLTLKKKGMAPPPMVPGKHNMDIGTWDAPSRHFSTPPAVPSPPPPIVNAPPPNEPSPLGPAKTNHNNNNPIGEHNPQKQLPAQQQQQHQNHQQQPQQQHNNQQPPQNQRSQQHQQPLASSGDAQQPGHTNKSNSGNQYQNNVHSSSGGRPPWNSHNNRHQQQQPPHNNMMPPHAQQPHHHHQQRSSEGTKGYQQLPQQQQQQSQGQPPSQQYHGILTRSQQPPPAGVIKKAVPISAGPPAVKAAASGTPPAGTTDSHPVLKELTVKNNYNPPEFDYNRATLARFFVIKSYSEDDIHRSIKYEIWCSTEHGNKRLDQAYRERESEGGVIFLFFSVNGSGHFCGMAQMVSPVDYSSNSTVWAQDKWKGSFRVKWIYVKDVPNAQLRYIHLENNENKPVTNSRDTQEVPNAKGLQVLKIMHAFKHTTSIFDDFGHYEMKQEEAWIHRRDTPATSPFEGAAPQTSPSFNKMQQNPFDKPIPQHHDRSVVRSVNGPDNYDAKTFKPYGPFHNYGSGGGRGGGGGSNNFHSGNQSSQSYGSYNSNGSGGSGGGFDRQARNNDYHQNEGGYNNGPRDVRDGGQNDFHRNNRNDFRGDFRRNDRSTTNGDSVANANVGNFNNREHDGPFVGRTVSDRTGNHRDHYRERENNGSGRGRGRGRWH